MTIKITVNLLLPVLLLLTIVESRALARQGCEGLSIQLGPAANTGGIPAVLASHTLTLDPTWRSARLFFKSGEVLPDGSYLRVTSLDDMAVQNFTSAEIGEWRHSSAYFNTATSHQLLLELVCAPHTSTNQVSVIEVCPGPGFAVDPACNLCVPQPPNSSEKWAARTIGVLVCSAAMYSTSGCLVSVLHCRGEVGDVAQFNTPPSTATGQIVHPSPQDQYIVSAIMKDPLGSSDWAVMRLGRSEGLTAFQRQGEVRRIGRAFSVAVGDPLRTVGYGAAVGATGIGHAAQKDSPGAVVTLLSSIIFTHDGFVQAGNSGGGVVVRKSTSNPAAVEVLAAVVSTICDDGGGPVGSKCISIPWPVRHAPFLAAIDSFCADCIRDCDGDGVISPADRTILVNWIATYNPMGDLTGNGFVDSA
ncbi:MAG: hypothetical protein ACKVW3_17955, partial [Phycisphaerales bacterium]